MMSSILGEEEIDVRTSRVNETDDNVNVAQAVMADGVASPVHGIVVMNSFCSRNTYDIKAAKIPESLRCESQRHGRVGKDKVRKRNVVDEIELRSRCRRTAAQVLGQAADEEEHSRTIVESRHTTKKDVRNQRNKQPIGPHIKKRWQRNEKICKPVIWEGESFSD
jgi:hypothetical protein